MTDADILAIQRKRRQQSRCIRCGRPAPRCTLCAACRVDWRYCARCESVYRRRPERTKGDASDYCLPCNQARHGNTRTAAEYQAERKARQHPLLEDVIRLYERGLSYAAIARALGRPSITNIISQAKQRGHWPATLEREIPMNFLRGQRKGRNYADAT